MLLFIKIFIVVGVAIVMYHTLKPEPAWPQDEGNYDESSSDLVKQHRERGADGRFKKKSIDEPHGQDVDKSA